jgi:hypothetical protein
MTRPPNPSRDARDVDLDAEIHSHLAMAAQERIARGESPGDAIAAARREFGNVGHVKEVTRETWGGMWFERLVQDLRYAWRSLRRSPGFAAVAIGTLALGIGANAAMFTVVNSVLIQPLPYRQASQLVFMYGSFSKFDRASISPPDFLDYRERNDVFESFAAQRLVGTATVTGEGEPERVSSTDVTANFFSTLGVASTAFRRSCVQ